MAAEMLAFVLAVLMGALNAGAFIKYSDWGLDFEGHKAAMMGRM